MAEVKVKITAANQTQTGFQSVLADAQKTAAQVQQTFARASEGPRMPKTFTPDPSKVGPIDLGESGLEPLRELQRQLRQAREASQQAFDPAPTQQYSQGIGGVLGRFALLIGAAATVGKIVAAAFDQLSEAVRSAIGVQEQFNRTLEQAGQATNLDGAISAFGQLQASAEQTGKIVEETFGRNIGESIANLFSGRPGQVMARAADLLTGGAVRGELTAQEEQQRRIARDTTRGNLARLSLEAEERTATGGDPRALEKLEREQKKRRELESFRARIQNETPQVRSELESLFREAQAEEDKAAAARERFQTERDITREKEKQAALESGTRRGNVIGRQLGPGSFEGIEELRRQQEAAARALGPEFGPGTAEAAAGGFRVDAANFALQQREEAARAAQKLAQQTAFGGDFGASALQRIGGASTEFFRVRGDDPKELQRRSNEFLRRIVQALEKGEPLVLGNSR